MSSAVKLKAKRQCRPIYLSVQRLVNPETGELIGALVPSHPIDQRLLRERKYHVGTELRAELKRPRNPRFNRLVHALGALASDQIDAFSGLDAHAAIKRLQRESGLCCEEMELDLGPLGKLAVKVPQSIAFDEMDETQFHELFRGISRHLAMTYWPGLSEDDVAQQAELMTGSYGEDAGA